MSVAKKPAFWAITIAITFFVISLTQIGRYGLSYDEPAGIERGARNRHLGDWIAPAGERRGGQLPARLGIALAVNTKLAGLFVRPIFLIPWLTQAVRRAVVCFEGRVIALR